MPEDRMREILLVVAITFGWAVISTIVPPWPGIKLTEFYLWLFNRTLPSSLELGGLVFAYLMSFCYGFGLLWGYLIGFQLVPRLGATWGLAAKWGLAFLVYLLWTLLVFDFWYREALRQARNL